MREGENATSKIYGHLHENRRVRPKDSFLLQIITVFVDVTACVCTPARRSPLTQSCSFFVIILRTGGCAHAGGVHVPSARGFVANKAVLSEDADAYVTSADL